MKPLNVVTIISKNYLAFARVLANSFKEYNPNGKMFVLLADHVDDYFDPEKENFTLVQLDELRDEVKNLDGLCFQYKIYELCTALKPFVLKHLLQKYNLDNLAYIDPDILITANLDELAELLEKQNILITPHLTTPYNDEKHPTELTMMLVGAYNLGFIAVANNAVTLSMLDWWQTKMYKYCMFDPGRGLFYDQKCVDLIPGLFEGTYILRSPKYNVAYWNLHERSLTSQGNKILCNGEILCFFHFSGFDVTKPHIISKYQNRHFLSNSGEALFKLFSDYTHLLIENGHLEISKWPCHFNKFDNNMEINSVFRNIYLKLTNPERFGNPFQTGENSYLAWMLSSNGDQLAPLLIEIYLNRPDLQSTFPAIEYVYIHRYNYLEWFFKYGVKEYKIDESALSPIQTYFNDLQQKAPKDNNQLEFGVNVFGYFNSEKGMGEAVRSDIRCLEKTSYPFGLCNVTDPGSLNSEMNNTKFSNMQPYRINLLHINADQAVVQAKHIVSLHQYNIGCWVWELAHFPEKWHDAFKYFQEIWVPSSFNQETLESISPIPIVKMPLSIEIPELDPPSYDRKFFGIPEDKVVFLFMFDFDSIFARKNPDGTIRAFLRAFSENDNAVLVIKHIHAEHDLENFQKLLSLKSSSQVIFLDQVFSKEQVRALIKNVDCYVSLHRSEGFGLTIAEAMSLEKPVIATAYSGNTDFMTPENSYAVGYQLTTLAQEAGPYKKGSIWAEPDLDQAAKLMRHVYENPQEARERGKAARKYIIQYFSPDAVAKKYQERLLQIATMIETGSCKHNKNDAHEHTFLYLIKKTIQYVHRHGLKHTLMKIKSRIFY